MTLVFQACVFSFLLIDIIQTGNHNQTFLDLSLQNLTNLEQADWADYPTITFFNISHNSFETIGILSSDTIDEIDASYGQLRWVRNGNFRDVKKLSKLFLHHNRHLTTIDLDCKSLVYLDASHCSVAEASLHRVPNLRVLNLSYNRIKEIHHDDWADNVNLEDVDLSYNDIEVIAEYAFMKHTKLYQLNLTRNKISMTDWTMPIKNLNILQLSFNEIENIDMMILRRTRWLNVSHNKLAQLPEEVGRLLPELELLDATSNPIRNIQRVKSKKLQKLLLKECRISDIGRNAFQETDVMFVDVSDNKLRNWDFVLSLKNATIVLDDNPLQCVCNISFKLDIFCQPDNVTLAEFCANGGEDISQDPWFLEAANPVIWAPLIVALVIIVVACIGLRTYKKYRRNRERESYESVPIDLIQNLPAEHLKIVQDLLSRQEESLKKNREHSKGGEPVPFTL